MFNFIKATTQETQDLTKLTSQLFAVIEQQINNKNITAKDLQKLINLVSDTVRLRSALTYL